MLDVLPGGSADLGNTRVALRRPTSSSTLTTNTSDVNFHRPFIWNQTARGTAGASRRYRDHPDHVRVLTPYSVVIKSAHLARSIDIGRRHQVCSDLAREIHTVGAKIIRIKQIAKQNHKRWGDCSCDRICIIPPRSTTRACLREARCRSVGGAVCADNVFHNLCRRVRSKVVERERSRSSRTRGIITEAKSKGDTRK